MSTQKNKVVVNSCHGHEHTENKLVVSSCHEHEHTEEQGRGEQLS